MPGKEAKASAKMKKGESPPMAGSKDICFVIMPFGGRFDEYYEGLYIPAIKNAGFEPRRADDLYGAGHVLTDIWLSINEAKIILADITENNPNVFYELGLAHAVLKPVIIVKDKAEELPFDIYSYRVLKYDKNKFRWGKVLEEDITKAIKGVARASKKKLIPPFHDIGLRQVDKDEKNHKPPKNETAPVSGSNHSKTGGGSGSKDKVKPTSPDPPRSNSEPLPANKLPGKILQLKEKGKTRDEIAEELTKSGQLEADVESILNVLYRGR